MELDEKTEKIAALERELVHKDQQMEGVQQQIRDLQHKNEWVHLPLFTISKLPKKNWHMSFISLVRNSRLCKSYKRYLQYLRYQKH